MLTVSGFKRWWREVRCNFGSHVWGVFPDIPPGVSPHANTEWPGIGRCIFCGTRKKDADR